MNCAVFESYVNFEIVFLQRWDFEGWCLMIVFGIDSEMGHSPLRANCPTSEYMLDLKLRFNYVGLTLWGRVVIGLLE